MMFDLTGMTALVTGASGGLGSSIAKALSAQGARLALSGSNVDKLNAFAAELGGDHVALPCNLSDAAAVDGLVPAAVEALGDAIKNCRTLVWNGPLGAFETPPFDAATVALARIAAALTKDGGLVSVAGGGDTVAALNHAGVADDFTYVSAAGGAFLEWMEGKELPGVAALEKA